MKNYKKILSVAAGALAVSIVLSVITTQFHECLSVSWLSPEAVNLTVTGLQYASVVGYILTVILGLVSFVAWSRLRGGTTMHTFGLVTLIILGTLLLGFFVLGQFNCSSRCGDSRVPAIKSNMLSIKNRIDLIYGEQKTYLNACNDSQISPIIEIINSALQQESYKACRPKSVVVCSSEEENYLIYTPLPNIYRPSSKISGFFCADSTGFLGQIESPPTTSTCR